MDQNYLHAPAKSHEHAAPVEANKTCSALELFHEQVYHKLWGDGMFAYCDKTTGKIEHNPILDFKHLPPT